MASIRTYPPFVGESGTVVPTLVRYTVPDVVDTVRSLSASMDDAPYVVTFPDTVQIIGTHRATGERVHYIVKGE